MTDVTGESVTIIRKDYTITYIKPCTMEKGKKMAKIRLKHPPKDLFNRLEKGVFDKLVIHKNLGVAHIRLRQKQIIVFASGEISIRAARDKDDVLQTADILTALLSPTSTTKV